MPPVQLNRDTVHGIAEGAAEIRKTDTVGRHGAFFPDAYFTEVRERGYPGRKGCADVASGGGCGRRAGCGGCGRRAGCG